MDKIITISRQYGSGGREIAQKLAKEFQVPFYDNELITQAAKESGFAESAFLKAEDKASNSLLYSIAMGISTYGNQDFGFAGLSIDDRIFLAQADTIRKIASKGPCIIVGRCADYVLKEVPNVVNIFICADLEFRVQRAIQLYDLPKEKVAENVLKKDKRRANYYNYHSNEKWGRMGSYHMSIRSDFGGVDHAVSCIKAYVEVK